MPASAGQLSSRPLGRSWEARIRNSWILLNALGLALASTAAAAAFFLIPWRSNYSPFLISYTLAGLALAISQSASMQTAAFKARWFFATLASAVFGLIVASAILSVPLMWLILSTAHGPLPPVASALAVAAFGAAGGLVTGISLGCGQFLAPGPRYAWTRPWVIPCAVSFGLAGSTFALLYVGSLLLLPPTVAKSVAVLVPVPLAAFASGAVAGAITRKRLVFTGRTIAL